MTRIDSTEWSKVWTKFQDWLDMREENSMCPQCRNTVDVDWEDQIVKIQQLVNQLLTERDQR